MCHFRLVGMGEKKWLVWRDDAEVVTMTYGYNSEG